MALCTSPTTTQSVNDGSALMRSLMRAATSETLSASTGASN
ncbi:MAG: hypothetical protein NTW70_04240 [Chloroflexi bacterium]|nr:hypothetical protein [Chloroflexota bacterium]